MASSNKIKPKQVFKGDPKYYVPSGCAQLCRAFNVEVVSYEPAQPANDWNCTWHLAFEGKQGNVQGSCIHRWRDALDNIGALP